MLQAFLRWMGFGLCHQIPERSYIGGGLQAPVCARDTGIYVGFVIALGVLWLLHKGERPRGFPPLPVWLVMGLLVALMGWDGVSSYAGWRSTTNDLRLITGLGVGFSAATVIYPMLNDELWRGPGVGQVLGDSRKLLIWLVAIPASYLLIAFGGPLLGIGLPLVIAVCIVVALTAINLVIIAMFPWFDRRASSWRHLVLPSIAACALAFVEIALAAQLRIVLLGVLVPT